MGEQPLGLEKMLRIYFLQQWFNLSDPQAEDAIYDSEAMRRFARVELGDDVVPDETTILRFRHLLEEHHLTAALFETVKELLTAKRLLLQSGTIVDATIVVHMGRGDLGAALGGLVETMALSDMQGFPVFRDVSRILHGLARVWAGQGTAALAEVAEALTLVAAGTRTRGGLTGFLLLLAQGQRAAGQHAEALGTVERGLAVATETGQHFSDAGLHQLKGELLLATEPTRVAEAEALFRRALDIARAQEAKSFELRAATSLARLWHCQSKRAEARALLAPVYAWFTEGFDTRDLVEAKALLDELA